MFKDKRILAVIPARSGSKELPKKNIALLQGKPLIYYTINSAKNSKLLDSIFVSTDDKSIAAVSRRFNASIINRPKRYASDTAKTIDVVKHSIRHLDKKGDKFDAVAVLQPTSPIRLSSDIDNCVKLLFENKLDSVISVVKVRQHPHFMFKMNKSGNLSYLLHVTRRDTRRQTLRELFYPNGSIYVASTEFLMDQDSIIFGGKCMGYLMDEIRSVDIDTSLDLKLCGYLLRYVVKS